MNFCPITPATEAITFHGDERFTLLEFDLALFGRGKVGTEGIAVFYSLRVECFSEFIECRRMKCETESEFLYRLYDHSS